MDFASVAGAATAFLAPFIPTLLTKATVSFDEAVKEFGSKLGESTWESVTALWSSIRRRSSKPDAAAKNVDKALTVEGTDARQHDWAALRDALTALMKADPEFAETFAATVEKAKAREEASSFNIQKQIAKYIVNAHSISHSHFGDRS